MLSTNETPQLSCTTIQNWIVNETALNLEYSHYDFDQNKRVVKKLNDFIVIRCDFNLRNCDPKFGEIVVQDLNKRDIKFIGLNSLTNLEVQGQANTLELPTPIKSLEAVKKINNEISQKNRHRIQLIQEYNDIQKEIMATNRSDYVVSDKIVDNLAKLVIKGFDIDKVHGSYQIVVRCRMVDIFIEQNKKQEALETFKSLPSRATFVDDCFWIDHTTLKLYDKEFLPFNTYVVNRIIKEYGGDLEWYYKTCKQCSEAHAKEFIQLRDKLKKQIKTVPSDSEYFKQVAIQVLKTDDWASIPSNDIVRVLCMMSFIKIGEGNKAEALKYYNQADKSIGRYIPDLFVYTILQLQLHEVEYAILTIDELKTIFEKYRPSYLKWIAKHHATPDVVEKFNQLKKDIFAKSPEATYIKVEKKNRYDSDSDSSDTDSDSEEAIAKLKTRIVMLKLKNEQLSKFPTKVSELVTSFVAKAAQSSQLAETKPAQTTVLAETKKEEKDKTDSCNDSDDEEFEAHIKKFVAKTLKLKEKRDLLKEEGEEQDKQLALLKKIKEDFEQKISDLKNGVPK